MLDGMTNIKAREVLKELKDYTEDLPHYAPDEVSEALELANKALEQTERIVNLVKELHLEDVSQKDFDNMFYLQSVKEVKEEMWRMYCFAEDVRYTLMEESEEKE